MIFRTLVNPYDEKIDNVTFTNSKGTVIISTNSSDNSIHSIAPDNYQIKIGNYEHEHKFYLGGVYTILSIPTNITDYVNSQKKRLINQPKSCLAGGICD